MKVCVSSRKQIFKLCSLRSYTYQIDPYIGCEHLCYYCYALNDAETDWTQEILIYQDFVDSLEQELSTLKPQPVYFGWNSDPYQPAEENYRYTRQAIEILAERGFSVSILTKSDLVLRDVDVIKQMPESSVGLSIAFQEEDVRELFEAKAQPNHRRIAALKSLKEAGIETYALICPIMPFISDLEALIGMAAAHADTLWFYGLSMNEPGDRNWRYVRKILDDHFPELMEKYHRIAFSSNHPYWLKLRHKLEEIKLKSHLNMKIEV